MNMLEQKFIILKQTAPENQYIYGKAKQC